MPADARGVWGRDDDGMSVIEVRNGTRFLVGNFGRFCRGKYALRWDVWPSRRDGFGVFLWAAETGVPGVLSRRKTRELSRIGADCRCYRSRT